MSEVQITKYIQSLGLSGASADAKRAELEKLSNSELTALLSGTTASSSKGTTLENTSTNEKKIITLKSGRRIELQNGITKYYAADGTELNEKYFTSKEGQIDIKKSGRYSINLNGQIKYYAADGTELKENYFKQVESNDVQIKLSDGKTYNLNETLESRINNVTKDLSKAEDSNGFIGKTWSGFKNLTGIGDSSDKVREQQELEQKLLTQFNNNEQTRAKTFKDLTGVDYTQENIEKFIKGEIKLKSETALQGYNEGQEMAVDVGADIVSGIASVGIYAAAVAATPFTGGASIAVGIGAATASGAAIKAGLKGADAASAGREYSLKDAGHDAVTGAFSGALAPVTGGMGGAVGKTVATKLGIQAVKQVGKEVAEEAAVQTAKEAGKELALDTAKQLAKQTGKEIAAETTQQTAKEAAAETAKQLGKESFTTMMQNPTGYQYIGGNVLKRGTAMSAEMATDGAVGGAVDNAFRTAYDGGTLEEVANSAVEGFVGGAIMSPLIGGGMKAAGKVGHELGSKLHNQAPEADISTAKYIDPNEQINHINKPDEGIPAPKVQETKPAMPLPQHIIEQPDGTKILTPEGEKIVRAKATELHNAAVDKEAEIVTAMQEAGFGIDKETMTHRPKSEQSIYDKVSSSMTDKKYPATFEKAVKGVYDAVGTRTRLDDFDYKDYPDIVEVYKTDPEKAYIMAAERQSQQFAKKLENLIIQQSQGKSNISAAKISNYMGKDGIPYLSKEQIEHINFVAAQHGVELNIKDPSPKIRPSGYTAYQMNFKTKDGFTFEWQLRGSQVNDFAECEHVPYDIRQGKDVTGGRKELKALYQPIEDIIHNLSDDQFNRYNQYLTDHYKHLRKIELGFDSTAPKLEAYGDFGALDKRLSAENLEALHDNAAKLKDGKISEETALKLYNYELDKEPYFIEAPPYTETEKAEILSKLNLTEKDMDNITNPDAIIAYFDLASKILPDSVEDVKAIPKDELIANLQSGDIGKIKDTSILRYENIEKLMTDFNMDAEDAGYMLLELASKPENSKYISNLIYYNKLIDQKLSTEDITNLIFYNKPALKGLSPERLEKIAYVANGLDVKLDPRMFYKIDDVEKITPEFVQNLKIEYEKAQQNGVRIELGERNFTTDYEVMKKINEACEKYEISFNDIESTYYSQIEELVNLENFDKVAEFIKKLSPEAKASKINPFYHILAKENGAVKLEPDASLAELYNAMAKFKDDYYISNGFVEDLSKLGVQDFSGPAKLLDAFADVGKLPSPYVNGSNMASNFIVANGDYDGAAKYIRSLKDQGKFTSTNIERFSRKASNKAFDFNYAADINKTLIKNGLLENFDGHLDVIYYNKELDITKITELINFILDKHPSLDPFDGHIEDFIELTKNMPSMEKIKENSEIIEALFNSSEMDDITDVYSGYKQNDYYKFLINNVDSNIIKHNIEFLKGKMTPFNIAKFATINKKITNENLVIDGKTYGQVDGNLYDFLKLYNMIENNPELYEYIKKSGIYDKNYLDVNKLYNALSTLTQVKKDYPTAVFQKILERDLLTITTDSYELRKLADIDDNSFKIYKTLLGNGVNNAGLNFEEFETLISGNLVNSKLNVRASLLEKLNNLSDDAVQNIAKQGIDINMYKTRLAESLGINRPVIKTEIHKQKDFLHEIVANNNPQAENVLKTFDFTQYNDGIPLKYPRNKFNDDIEILLSQLSDEDQYKIRNHFRLEQGEAGFEGLPVVTEFKDFEKAELSERTLYIADKIADRIKEFTLNNEVLINDKQTKEVFDALIQGLPEFTTIVGKKQHGTHAYTVDIHTLKVLQSAMNDPMYKELSEQDKTILKIAAILHDTGKKGGVVDRGHASLSSDYARAVLNKFQLNDAVKTRIIDIVDNHHWFEKYNTRQISAETMAANCRRPEDFKISMILAKSDLSNVNPTFHFEKTGTANQAEFDAYMRDKARPIEEKLEEMREKANIVFDTQFTRAMEKFPTQKVNINGEEVDLKVLNLTDETINDLEQYGFAPGTTKDNARFTVHMTRPDEFPTVEALLANTSNKSTWSTSLISLDNNRTYTNRKYGFILDVDKPNVAQAYYGNLASGMQKDISDFASILFDQSGETRTFVRDGFIEAMKERGLDISLQDYAQISKYIFSKKYTTQIKDIKIGDRTFKADDLVYAFEKSRDALFQGYEHSEIVSINPRIKGLIARVSDINDVPSEFLEFARKKNLPIVLIGFKNPQ